MGARIITGYTGEKHITPSDDAHIFASLVGDASGSYILEEGSNLAGSMPSINEFLVADGVLYIQGRMVIVTSTSLAVDTAPTGYRRIDLVCARYTHDSSTQIEEVELLVIKGDEVASGTPTAPSYNTGVIAEGASTVDVPLYQITLNGGTVTFSTMATTLEGNIKDVASILPLANPNNLVGANSRQGWTALTSGQNLNSITTPGVYWAQTDTIAASLVNAPSPYACKFVVEYTRNNQSIRQTYSLIVASGANQGNAWTRATLNGGSTWGDWIHIPQQTEVDAIANRGGKNMINLPAVNGTQGVSATKNADGSLSLTGNYTGSSDGLLSQTYFTLPAGSYIITGGTQAAWINAYVSGKVNANDKGSGATFSLATETSVRVAIYLKPGAQTNGVTVYPMIRNASITDPTYVPYGMSNAELTARARTDASTTKLTTQTGEASYRVINGMMWISIWDLKPTTAWTVAVSSGVIPSALCPFAIIRMQGYYGAYGKNQMTINMGTNGQIQFSAQENATSADGSATIIYPVNI